MSIFHKSCILFDSETNNRNMYPNFYDVEYNTKIKYTY